MGKILPFTIFGLAILLSLLISLLKRNDNENKDNSHLHEQKEETLKEDIEGAKQGHLSDMKTTAQFSKTRSKLQADISTRNGKSEAPEKNGKRKNSKEIKHNENRHIDTSYKLNNSKALI